MNEMNFFVEFYGIGNCLFRIYMKFWDLDSFLFLFFKGGNWIF